MINSGREFHLRLSVQCKQIILELLDDRPMFARELQQGINDRRGNTECNIQRVVNALQELHFEGLVFPLHTHSGVMLWQKTPPEVVEKRKRNEDAVKVYRVDDESGS
jgi:DNA-binding PadR family transcriptional regulator